MSAWLIAPVLRDALYRGYAATEAAPHLALLPLRRLPSKALSTGQPIRPTITLPHITFFRQCARSPHNRRFSISKKPNSDLANGLHHQHKQHFLSVLGTGARQDGCWQVRCPVTSLFTAHESRAPDCRTATSRSWGNTDRWLIDSQEQEIVQGQEGPEEEGPGPLRPQGLVRNQGELNPAPAQQAAH